MAVWAPVRCTACGTATPAADLTDLERDAWSLRRFTCPACGARVVAPMSAVRYGLCLGLTVMLVVLVGTSLAWLILGGRVEATLGGMLALGLGGLALGLCIHALLLDMQARLAARRAGRAGGEAGTRMREASQGHRRPALRRASEAGSEG